MDNRRQTFRLYPNKDQEQKLFEARRVHAYVYNACIAHRRFEWKKNNKTVTYFDQQNCLPEFKKEWIEFAYIHSQAMQATVKRVDLAYNSFFQRLRGLPGFKSIRYYSGWTYPAKSGWKVNSNGKHGRLTLNDLGITLKIRGKAKQWGIPSTLTIVYKPSKNQWFASITVDIPTLESRFSSESKLEYQNVVAFDLGTQTAITLYDGSNFDEVENPRFTKKTEQKIKKASKELRRKRSPNKTKKIKASNRWKKARKRVSILQAKVATQRKDWQHKVTSDIASRYDIGVTEKLETKKMTKKAKKGSKRKKQKAGLNKSILSVGFGALNQMIAYKIEQKGGVMLILPTKKIKPSQRCPNCGKVHKEWAELSNRYHVCNKCKFEIQRDKGSVMVMYNVAIGKQPGAGTSLADVGLSSSTDSTKKRKHTGSMKQLGKMKRQNSINKTNGDLETPSVFTVG
ncbi:transposase [Aetokthonos hydrillicola Thurmond2011]|uniref:Transposase n=1 Tax=Aetokthonos hydrillicola Thurmond2011 TaxID=2712845 RepID=A0AAP5IGJ2_9CYAN|nr:transposase [Aetokthonos hydrillicola]MDR9899862.1 transposase [Aetokthonos hydrillicola Thurmond2011]